MVPSDCDDGHHGDGRMGVRPGGEAALSHGCAGDGVRGAIFRAHPPTFRRCGELGVQRGRCVPLPSRDVQHSVGWLSRLSGVRQARRRGVPEPSSAGAKAVAEHLCELLRGTRSNGPREALSAVG